MLDDDILELFLEFEGRSIEGTIYCRQTVIKSIPAETEPDVASMFMHRHSK